MGRKRSNGFGHAALPATVQVRASATPPWPGRRDAPRLQSNSRWDLTKASDGGRSCEVLTVLWVLTQTQVQAGGCGYRTFEHRERREEHLALFRVLTQLLDHLQMPYRIKPRRVRAQSWRRCGKGEPNPGADVAGGGPSAPCRSADFFEPKAPVVGLHL